MFEKLLTNLNFLLGLKIEGLFPTVFSPPLQGEVSRKPLAVYETEGLLLRLVVVLFYNPSVIFFENATSPYTGEARTERDIASQ